MNHLRDWLARLSTAETVGRHMARAFHAGNAIPPTEAGGLALEPQGSVPPVPGDTGPVSSSILYFPDPLGVSQQTLQVAEELGAVLSVASGRRVLVPPEIPLGLKGKVTFMQVSRGIDRELIGPLPPSTLARSVRLLNHIAALPAEDVQTLSPVLHLYSGACSIVERDVRSAYVMLVSALEIMSRQYGGPPTGWADWEDAASWDKLLSKLELAPQQAQAIRSRLLENRHLRLKRTFCNYVAEALPASFWEAPYEQWSYSHRPPTNDWSAGELTRLSRSQLVPRDRGVLHKALAQTYDTRSAYVHRGDTFSLEDSLRRSHVPVSPDAPVDYSLLRLILRELLLHELTTRGPLPTQPPPALA